MVNEHELENILKDGCLFMDFNLYKEEIELVAAQNPVERDIHSIVGSIIRELCGDKISLRDVSTRRRYKNWNIYYGHAGFPDYVVLTRNQKETQKVDILGAIEVKYITVPLDKNYAQLHGHICSFKRVIYTNGLKWQYYETGNIKHDFKWEIRLGYFLKGQLIWEKHDKWYELMDNLEKIDWRENLLQL